MYTKAIVIPNFAHASLCRVLLGYDTNLNLLKSGTLLSTCALSLHEDPAHVHEKYLKNQEVQILEISYAFLQTKRKLRVFARQMFT